jgi:hypothetical protein
MLEECAVGVEISEDRAHASIAAAGPIYDGFLMVELVDYLNGPAGAVEAVLRLQAERTVSAVVVDGRSHAATLIRPLTDAGVQVTQPSTSDVAVATGQFLDELATGRLRHNGNQKLTAAVRHGTSRPLSGAVAWERRGHTVDVAPLVAATLALWGWSVHPHYDLLQSVW